ncbi:MAG: hypothetical protein HUJ65_07835 [Oscillospiraceae bacterium]|nr:hypothetical protein [Oscillospiraceae bacterium]
MGTQLLNKIDLGGGLRVRLGASGTEYRWRARGEVSERPDGMFTAASASLKANTAAIIVFAVAFVLGSKWSAFLFIALAALLVFVYLRVRCTISIDYYSEGEELNSARSRLTALRKISRSRALWYMPAGATSLEDRLKCRAGEKLPFPFRTGSEAVCFRCGSKRLVFLPDRLYVISGTSVSAIDYDSVSLSTEELCVAEEEKVPGDANVIGKTWRYVRHDGRRDPRRRDNKRLPVCRYGRLKVASGHQLSMNIVFSNYK